MKKNKTNILFSLGMFSICILFLTEKKLSYPSNVFPYSVIFIIIIISIILLVESLFFLRINNLESKEKKKASKNYRKAFLVTFAYLIFIILLNYLGFYIPSMLFIAILTFFLQGKKANILSRTIRSLSTAFIVFLIVYLLFGILLKVPLPKGTLF